jgi:hypothetical protein
MMPSLDAASASGSASSTCGNRAQMNIPELGSVKISSPISSNACTTLMRAHRAAVQPRKVFAVMAIDSIGR